MQHPFLAKISAHLFTSLYTWATWIYVNLAMRDLQSKSNGENLILALLAFFNISTITLASSSTYKHPIPNWIARFKPSLNAHNSAITLVVCPIDLKYPLIHLLSLSQISPPLPALPGFLREAISVLSLCQLGRGLDHLIGIAILGIICLALLTQKWNSLAWLKHTLSSVGFGTEFSNTT